MTFRCIVVPVDLSGKARPAIDLACELAESNGGTVHLLHVRSQVTAESSASSKLLSFYQQLRAEQRLIAESQLRDLCDTARHRHEGVEIIGTLRRGVIHDAVCAFADEVRADLIVIRASGISGIAHFMIGSTTERVVRDAPVPVLTIRDDSRAPIT